MISRFTKPFARFISMALLLSLLLTTALADHGRGRGRGNNKGRRHIPSGQVKKADKFVNGHDARDGRWDGRGPKQRRGRRW
jgi:hypothetical protein